MKKYKFLLFLILIFTLLVLFNPKLALEGAKGGLLLWFQSLLPALLPFMILSGILVETKVLLPVCRFLHHPLKHLLPISPAGCIALFLGFFCGFPVGARVVSDLLRSRQISKSEAQYLLGICNNFSPAFLTGFVSAYIPNIPLWNVFLVVYGAPLLFGFLSGKWNQRKTIVLENENFLTAEKGTFTFSIVDDSIMRGFSSIAKLGGYLILFGIFAKMVTALKTVTILKAFLLAITEITTSIPYTAAAISNPFLKESLILAGLVFGGLSGIAQTKSMTSDCPLSLRSYAASRLKITGIALLLTGFCIFIRNLPV